MKTVVALLLSVVVQHLDGGVAVRVNEKVTLTVKSAGQGNVAVEGLPELTTVFDSVGRPTTVSAGGSVLARFAYTDIGEVAEVAVPGRFSWKLTLDAWSPELAQTVVDAGGEVVAKAVIAKARGTGSESIAPLRTTPWPRNWAWISAGSRTNAATPAC